LPVCPAGIACIVKEGFVRWHTGQNLQGHREIAVLLANLARERQVVCRREPPVPVPREDGMVARMIVRIGNERMKHILRNSSAVSFLEFVLTRRSSSASPTYDHFALSVVLLSERSSVSALTMRCLK